MNAIHAPLPKFVERLATEAAPDLLVTLAHTLWQGAAVAALLAAALRVIPASRAALRHGVAVAALALLVLATSVTWTLIDRHGLEAGIGAQASTLTPDVAAAPLPPAADHAHGTGAAAAAPRESAPDASSSATAGTGAASVPAAAPIPAAIRTRLESISHPLAGLYAVGVLVMLARAAAMLHAAGRLRREGRPLADPLLLAEVDRLRGTLRVARSVRLAVADDLNVPCVLGLLAPTILLPASLLAGTPPEHIRMILAHELAHVRRHDYLINLLQLLVEALLFFNPAVWWISRQIRAEREAAADALAVSAIGAPVAYATTLAEFAERLLNPTRNAIAAGLAPAFAAPNRPNTLLDRVRRIVAPGHRPHVRLPWPALVVALVLGTALLASLWQTGRAIAQVAADLLTPAQRVEQIARIARENSEPPFNESDPKATFELTGRVRTHDGTPVPPAAHLTAHLERQNYSSTQSLSVDRDGKFRIALHPGPVYLAAHAKGYAPAFAGPIQLAPDRPHPPVDLVLTEGFTAKIDLRDPSGMPVPGAKLVGGHTFPKSSWSYTLNAVADAGGAITLPHFGDKPATLQITAPGFQRDRKESVTLEPDRPLAWTLRPATPLKGVVRTRPGDQPLPGARVRFVRQTGGAWNDGHSFDGAPVWAVTDENGAFTLDELRDDASYSFMVEAHDHAPAFVENVSVATQRGALTVALGPEIYVAGTVTGDLTKLQKQRGKPTLTYSRTLRMADGSHGSYEYAPVTIEDGVGRFRIGQLWPGRLTINAPDGPVALDVTGTKTDVRIDVGGRKSQPPAKPRRTVVFRFETPAGSPPPTGAIAVHAQDVSDMPRYPRVEIKDGQARLDVVVPNVIQYAPTGTVGYWFPEANGIGVDPGDGPLEIAVPARPAGAIHGRVLQADGSAAPGREVGTPSLVTVTRPPGLEDGPPLSSDLVTITSDGKFVASPLPIGGTYALLASRKQAMTLSAPIAVTERAPIHQVDLKFAAGVTVAGRVVDTDGKPLAGMPVAFSYVNPYNHSHGFSPPPRTGPDGRFAFDGVNDKIAGSYTLSVSPDRAFQPASVPVDFAALPLTIRLLPGQVATGVLQEEGGAPVKGATVIATLADHRPGDLPAQHQAEAATDDRGAFRFSTLAAGRRYHVHVGGRQLTKYPATITADDGATAATILVKRSAR
jgi:beta-lactamase regulating signal transducer with metallopeptidase domain